MIYIFGIGHHMQMDRTSKDEHEYAKLLREKIKELKPQYIVEEWNEESTEAWNDTHGTRYKTSVTQDIVNEFDSISYRGVELTKSEQIGIGIRPEFTLCANIIDQNLIDGKLPYQDLQNACSNLFKPWKIEEIRDRQSVEGKWFERIKDIIKEDIFFVTGLEHISPMNLQMWRSLGISENELPIDKIFGFNKLLEFKKIPYEIIVDSIKINHESLKIYPQTEFQKFLPCSQYINHFLKENV